MTFWRSRVSTYGPFLSERVIQLEGSGAEKNGEDEKWEENLVHEMRERKMGEIRQKAERVYTIF